jgi:hypothetical protein
MLYLVMCNGLAALGYLTLAGWLWQTKQSLTQHAHDKSFHRFKPYQLNQGALIYRSLRVFPA